MKQIAALVLTFILSSTLTRAQQLGGSPELTVLTKSDLMVQSVLTSASSVQVGQTGEIVSYQQGSFNRQNINPNAGENSLRLVQQGNFNNMDLNVLGEGNNYQFSQLGNNNDLQLRSLEASNNTLQIVQRGNDNQLIDNSSGLLNRPIRIEQSGGMKILINGQ
ncbi:hypothetical protein [Persicitalea jodogahamensis]|uniref:Curlin associated repeat-containing protein n=1 Tax=Persicitalea jodogahamensis TaxID=402147 RepID=A0A8J3G7P4_9BACT|nr:hypothetical protein [Persicitalea jodogahamensis]GHB58341.1 hypothetical protein GCM10007390_09790 [Persicitalea jodogahamensis]